VAAAIQAALTSITAAVVGVIMNLALFFGSRVIIKSDGYPDGFALVEALLAFLLLWRYRLPIHIVVVAGGSHRHGLAVLVLNGKKERRQIA